MYKKAQISRSKDLPMQLPATSVWSKFDPGHGTKITNVIPQLLIQFYPESGIQNNKCNTVNIHGQGTKITIVVLRCSLIKFYTVPLRCVFLSP